MARKFNVIVQFDKTPVSEQEKNLRLAQFLHLLYKWERAENERKETKVYG